MTSKGRVYFSSLVEQLKTNPSSDAPGNGDLTYDQMILSLLLQVWEEAKEKGVEKDDLHLDEALVSGIKVHIAKLIQQDKENKIELENEEKEAQKKITSESIHDGWDSKASLLLA